MKSKDQQYRQRVEISVKKGAEELFPEEIYDPCLSGGLWIEGTRNRSVIKAYPKDVGAFQDLLRRSGIMIYKIRIVKEKDRDYIGLTKRYFRPIKIEDVVVAAPWNRRRGNKKAIIIEPGMAFGTGRHESTRIMIKLMKGVDINGKEVIDLGCGSAILSLYAALKGAKRVVAVDNDEDAIASAKKNASLNDIANIRFARAGLEDVKSRYDVVLANLDIRTFSGHAQHIVKRLKRGGCLIISGILGRDARRAISLFPSLTLEREERKNSWRGFVLKRQAKAEVKVEQ
ncbi:MAG TPA: 50S ribosomal protein L11 methyltransferase [Syntrophorhabdaceae bacterium]|nr:50S ribosomal protein L11 methyltransferase [Syntrophorhabdaceae bacterium]HQM80128.1 50S ribosomal protein L11 methyltransferase [Syntrophorhabdaceae bacterium]